MGKIVKTVSLLFLLVSIIIVDAFQLKEIYDCNDIHSLILFFCSSLLFLPLLVRRIFFFCITIDCIYLEIDPENAFHRFFIVATAVAQFPRNTLVPPRPLPVSLVGKKKAALLAASLHSCSHGAIWFGCCRTWNARTCAARPSRCFCNWPPEIE